jgi:type IV pilus assembly protein PilW
LKHFKLAKKTNPLRGQGGFTLVELLVAMGLGLLVIAIAGGALDAVDNGTQLRDKQRLAIDLLTRTVVQAGFEDYAAPVTTFRANAVTTTLEPDIFGWNNAILTTPSLNVSATTTTTNGDRPGKCGGVTDTSCRNGSDILAVRYQGVNSPTDATKADNSMVNCGGTSERGLTTNDLNERGVSIFHIATVNGEPSLNCSYYNHTTGLWQNPVPLIEGVESFQVLYGTDGVTPNTAPVEDDPATLLVEKNPLQDSIAERWLRADQLTVPGNAVATRGNWRRVRAIRIGLVLRGPVGSAQQALATTFNPLGTAYTDSANDVGAALAVSNDRRLRTVSSFTVHVRNDLTTR